MMNHDDVPSVEEGTQGDEPSMDGDAQVAKRITERLCASGLVSDGTGAAILQSLLWGEMTASLWSRYARISVAMGEQDEHGTD